MGHDLMAAPSFVYWQEIFFIHKKEDSKNKA